MTRNPRATSAEEPNGGNLHVRIRRGPGPGNRPGLLTKAPIRGYGGQVGTPGQHRWQARWAHRGPNPEARSTQTAVVSYLSPRRMNMCNIAAQ